VNTPAHLVVNLALLSSSRLAAADERGEAPPNASWWVAFGALLPDLPMFGFFVWQTIGVGASQRQIWDEAYFRESWQMLFDLFNSIPIAGLVLALALYARHRRTALVAASVLLHCALDLPLHHDDAHAHFLPFTSWHFESPVSYWDPQRLGHFGAAFEVLCVWLASWRLWRDTTGRWSRAALALLCCVSSAGYLALYWLC